MLFEPLLRFLPAEALLPPLLVFEVFARALLLLATFLPRPLDFLAADLPPPDFPPFFMAVREAVPLDFRPLDLLPADFPPLDLLALVFPPLALLELDFVALDLGAFAFAPVDFFPVDLRALGLPPLELLPAARPANAPITPPTTAPIGPATLPRTAPVAAPAACFEIGGIERFSDDCGVSLDCWFC